MIRRRFFVCGSLALAAVLGLSACTVRSGPGEPGKTVSTPVPPRGGVVVTPPGKVVKPPRHGGTPPGKIIGPPGHGGTPPGKVVKKPGNDWTPPGKTVRPPGHGGTPPGRVVKKPGHGRTPPGTVATTPGVGAPSGPAKKGKVGAPVEASKPNLDPETGHGAGGEGKKAHAAPTQGGGQAGATGSQPRTVAPAAPGKAAGKDSAKSGGSAAPAQGKPKPQEEQTSVKPEEERAVPGSQGRSGPSADQGRGKGKKP